MVFFRKRDRILSGRLVAFLFFLIPASILFSQSENSVAGEQPQITIEISPEKIIVGQRFDLTIFADFSSYRNVKIIEPELPPGITLASGPYKSAQTIRIGDLSDSQYIKKTRIFYKFKVSSPGLYSLDSFILSDGEKTLQTGPFLLPVLAFDERDLKYPVSARWNSVPEEIFVGETIPLILEIENLEKLSFPERVSMESPAGGVFEKVNSLGKITVTSIGDDEVYLAPIESWLYTPTVTGAVKIPAATVYFDRISRSTAAAAVSVVETPPLIESSGAIGFFNVSTEMQNLPLEKGQISTLKIRVEGEGNLNYLRMPQPDFSGLTVIGKEEQYNIAPSMTGFSGYREDIYRVSTSEEREVSIRFAEWSWYNKKDNSVITENLSAYQFQNISVSEEEVITSIRDEFSLMSPDKIVKYRDSVYDKGWYYLLILPGIISVLAALVKKRYDMRLIQLSLLLIVFTSSAQSLNTGFLEQLKLAETMAVEGESERALAYYDRILSEYGDNPAVYFNRALLHYDLNNTDRAVFNLRKALIQKPGDRTFLKALDSIENEYRLEHQVSGSSGLSPDLFFLFFIILFNLGALLIVFNIRKKKMELSILIIMIFFLSVISLSVTYYSDFISKKDTAVVLEPGGDLKKVPGEMGGSWLTLQEGVAVSIISESGDSLLIRTGYGLEGWLVRDSLILLQGGN